MVAYLAVSCSAAFILVPDPESTVSLSGLAQEEDDRDRGAEPDEARFTEQVRDDQDRQELEARVAGEDRATDADTAARHDGDLVFDRER